MDKFDGAELSDIPEIASRIRDRRSILFCMGVDKVNAYVIYIGFYDDKFGTLSFGGNPIGMQMVGVLGLGFNYLNLFKNGWFSPSYIQEKFRLRQPDAINIATILNKIREDHDRITYFDIVNTASHDQSPCPPCSIPIPHKSYHTPQNFQEISLPFAYTHKVFYRVANQAFVLKFSCQGFSDALRTFMKFFSLITRSADSAP